MEIEHPELKAKVIHDFPYSLKNRKCPHTSLISLTNAGGCIFACPMCYARAYTWSLPNKILVYENLALKLEQEIKTINIAFPFYLSQITDPLQPIESIRQMSLRVIKILLKHKLSFRVVTKCAEGVRYVLKKIPELISYPWWFLEMTIESTPQKQEITSPYAPKISERLKTLKFLNRLGIEVVCRTDPTILGLIDIEDLLWLIEKIKETGVQHIIASAGYYNKISLGEVLKRLQKSKFKLRIPKVIKYYQYDPDSNKKRFMANLETRIKFHEWFRKKAEERGLTYAVCQELPREYDSKGLATCEGSKRNPVHIRDKNGNFMPINCFGDCLRSCPDKKNPPCSKPELLTEYPYKIKTILKKKFQPGLF